MSYSTTNKTRKVSALLLSTILASGLAAPAAAQTYDQLTNPERPVIDERGVELRTGRSQVAGEQTGVVGAHFADGFSGQNNYHQFKAYVAASGANRTVFVNGVSKVFIPSGSNYVAKDGDGSTLVKLNSPERYTYTAPDGTIYQFLRLTPETTNPLGTPAIRAHLETVTRPDGHKTTYNYSAVQGPEVCGHTCFAPTYVRAQSITTSDGYMLKAEYASTAAGTAYNRLTGVKAIDRSVDYCDPYADTCSALTESWPAQTISEATASGVTTKTITDGDGNVTEVDLTGGRVIDVDRPLNTGDETQITNDANGRVDLLVADGASYDYSYSTSGSTQTTTVAGPSSTTETYVIDTSIARLMSQTSATGATISYLYDAQARRTRETQPEGNYTQWAYDSRGNVTEVRQVAKPGSGIADIVSTANFDATCTIQAKCNKPNYAIDPKGNRTDFTYDNTHGGVIRVQLPAATSDGTRPEINYVYASLYAQQKNASGVLVNAATPQHKITQITSCATAATCAGSASETKISFAYNTPNLLPSSKTAASGDGSISATETYTYDLMGNLRSVDGPLAGSEDTVWYYWGIVNKKLRGVIYPDPDGAGPLLRRAERYVYRGGKPIEKAEIGTVTTIGDLAGMTVAQTIDYVYDAKGKKIKEVLIASGATHQVVQFSYDAKNRLECTALRMNPAIFASLPASACTMGTAGSGANDYGPDRITQNIYDAASRVTQVKTAVGTAELANEITTGYTANGAIAYVIDAELNRTGYVYDGHDRLSQTRYPVSTKGADTANVSDYEELGYDANSNVTSRRLRDGNSIGYGYDNLNRLTSKDLPGSEPDATYSYDLLGRALSAVQNSQTLGFTHDALGRNLTQSGPLGTLTYGYDVAGRRTSMAYPGSPSLTVGYEYDTTGNVTAIKENGSTTLATYAYDNLGRRSSVTFGNGVVQSNTFDAVSRLATLTSDLASTGYDQIATFGYNPASQIDTLSKSNDGYAWAGHYNIDRVSAGNGLNQLTAATPGGGQVSVPTITHDARGNTTGIGSNAYGYSSENMLTTGPGGATLGYDPLGRLFQISSGGATTRFVYDGSDIVTEHDSGSTILRRYVHGPGTDNPIVHYEDGVLAGRRYLTSDERGSVVAITNGSGAVTSVNSYDEYGNPGAANAAISNGGRFGYTGQAWLPEIGMWYYKARIYNPAVGRFMQTDPIGYGDGMNWMNYVGSDPVNFTDPTGRNICAGNAGSSWTKFYDNNRNGAHDAGEKVVSRGTCPSDPSTLGGLNRTKGNGSITAGGGGTGTSSICRRPSSSSGADAAGFVFGAADGLSFGAFSELWGFLPHSGIEALRNTAGYDNGQIASFGLGAGRLAYAGSASALKYFDGKTASQARNILKGGFSGLGSFHPRAYSYEALLAKYGSDPAVAQAASRTNQSINNAAAGVVTSSTVSAAVHSGC